MLTITSRKNLIIQEFKNLINIKKERCISKTFVVEGEKISNEALNAGLLPQKALFTKESAVKYFELYKKAENLCDVIEISDELSNYISDTKTPQGVFLKFPVLDKSKKIDKIISNAKKVIILSSLQDAGNVGTIIRTADALGLDAVFLSENSPDIYSGKVLRGSMGSIFRIPVITAELSDIIELTQISGFTVYASILDKSAISLKELKFNEKSAIVIGNESNGISREIVSCCDKKIYIPINGAESLNAGIAASIIMWELVRNV